MLIDCQKVVQNFKILAIQSLSPALSSRLPWDRRHHLRVHDLKILSKLWAHLIGEEQEVILRLLHNAMGQVHSLL